MIRALLATALVAASLQGSFLKPAEHGEMIYHETRIVACAACHGTRAQGQIIAHYLDGNQSRTLYAPPLEGLSLEAITRGLARHELAPRYHLSDQEIENLSRYLAR